MSSLMTRSFAEALGVEWPPEVSHRVSTSPGRWRSVTWDEVHEERRRRQRDRLARIMDPGEPRTVPAYVWTFDVPGPWYAGWHCYMVTRTDSWGVSWRYTPALAENLMRSVPLVLPIRRTAWEEWKEELARLHPRDHLKDPRKAGSVVGWITDRRTFTPRT